MGAIPDQEWKKGSAELLILSLLEDQPRHGYDIGKLIEGRSGGKLLHARSEQALREGLIAAWTFQLRRGRGARGRVSVEHQLPGTARLQ